MPRKPYRTSIPVPDVLKDVPVFPRDRDHSFPPPQTPEERLAFCEAVVEGLLKRLARGTPGGVEVAREAIRMAREVAWPWYFWVEGKEAAHEETQELITTLSARGLARLKKPAPFKLLGEFQALVKQMPQGSYQRRRDWLLKQGLKQDDLDKLGGHFGAEVVERVIALRHNMSVSQVHKTLADDVKRLRAIPKGL